MATVYIHDRPVRLRANQAIAGGGEAVIYRLDAQTVLKLYRQPGDTDYANDLDAQRGARARLAEQQRKLPVFPRTLIPEVVAPTALAYDKPGGEIVGYTMPFVDGMDVLMRLANRTYRDAASIDNNQVIDLFRELRRVVAELHRQGVVIGDFNDLNVMTDAHSLRLVDADSMQYGGFLCHTYTNRFVDPLRCESSTLALARPHDESSDWYAYFVMLLQSLLFVGPYGGVHRPKAGSRLQHDARVLKRVTVLNDDVVYPKPAAPLASLPDDLLAYVQAVFEADAREPFPTALLDALRWTTCTNCGLAHARQVCPGCSAPGVVRQAVTIRGQVTARRVFRTSGNVLCAVNQGGTLRYLYQEGGVLYREGDRRLMQADLTPELRFRIQGDTTVIGRGNALLMVDRHGAVTRETVEQYRDKLPMFDTTAAAVLWAQNGQLVQAGRLGPQYLGDVLSNQTMFWVGERLGFGFYQAGQLVRSFVFRPGVRGLNDQVAITSLPGQLIDATCVFGSDRAWFMVSMQENGILMNRCYVIDTQGVVLATQTAPQGEDSWLGRTIRGHLATGSSLFAATDDGIVRVGVSAGRLVLERSFPDTEPFVDSHTALVQGPGGIYVVSRREITLLEIR